MMTLEKTIKLMFSDKLEDRILADYYQTLIKRYTLFEKIDLMLDSEPYYQEWYDELKAIEAYEDCILRKIEKMGIDPNKYFDNSEYDEMPESKDFNYYRQTKC